MNLFIKKHSKEILEELIEFSKKFEIETSEWKTKKKL